ncbi:MAG: TAT-variant-translocated molybdopterin oxidoreductase [Candidatus Eisenbacteria bacterium]
MSSMKNGNDTTTGRDYWRSLEEYSQTPEFAAAVKREFPNATPDMISENSRRDFLKVMGASLAFAGITGCKPAEGWPRWPEEKILPFTNRPEGRMPGNPVYYATAMELAGVGRGLLIKSFDGRPVKVEGNPLHPESQGTSDVLSQASILEMYDPDRMQSLMESQGSSGQYGRSWSEFSVAMEGRMARHRGGRGKGLAVLSEASSSPTLRRLRAQLQSELPESAWFEWEPIARDNERAGSRAAFGRPLRPQYRFDRAQVIASFDDDFLVSHPASVQYAFDFAEGRRMAPAGGGHGEQGGHGGDTRFNRLYAVEATLSPTGGMADHRLPVAPSEVESVLGELAAELLAAPGIDGSALGSVGARLGAFRQGNKHQAFVKQLAQDLLAHRGASLVVVGTRQPAAAHALAHAINAALGNVGHTVSFTEDPAGNDATHAVQIRELVERMKAGRVETLLILGGNPVFDAPADLDFGAALGQVDTSVHLTLYPNETTEAVRWRLPRTHYLESWGDARAWNGTVAIVQPLIRPLFDGRTPAEVVASVLQGGLPNGYDLVRETYQAAFGGPNGDGFEHTWKKALHDGVVADSALPAVNVAIDGGSLAAALGSFAPHEARAGADEIEVVLAQDACVFDGRFANNGWLQELPNTFTKLTWDNALLIGPRMAQEMGLADGDMVRLEAQGRSVEVPIWTTPGQAGKSGTLHLGYGRRVSGKVGTGVGFDAYPLRASENLHLAVAKISKAGGNYAFSATQDHFAIDEAGRKATQARLSSLIQEATLDEYLHGGHAEHGHHPPALPLWDPHEYNGHKWGLSIDLNACTGCNACVIACQSENNIPVVGKTEVSHGREMHWIRIDRYFRGDPDDPQVALQPVACQQCENAPCEQVCPVAATVHSHEGLNDMVYNRCIGTRYCANNCPYKVRRFNFFNFNGGMTAVEKMRPNPDVTMRARGVMEKCSFCVQRIQQVKIVAKNEKRPIADGEIRTACQQACPSQAIVFGDLNDPKSEVRRQEESDRTYALLDAELHTKPRLKYMKRLRNPAAGLTATHEGHGAAGDDAHHG